MTLAIASRWFSLDRSVLEKWEGILETLKHSHTVEVFINSLFKEEIMYPGENKQESCPL